MKRYGRFEKVGLEYPQNEYHWSTVKAVHWNNMAEVNWQIGGLPYITWRKLYQRKDGSYYCIFNNKRINVIVLEE